MSNEEPTKRQKTLLFFLLFLWLAPFLFLGFHAKEMADQIYPIGVTQDPWLYHHCKYGMLEGSVCFDGNYYPNLLTFLGLFSLEVMFLYFVLFPLVYFLVWFVRKFSPKLEKSI